MRRETTHQATPESSECFIVDQAFSPSPPSPPRQKAQTATHMKTEKERQLGGGGVREEPNRTMARKPGPL
jgi:hypothetical protein